MILLKRRQILGQPIQPIEPCVTFKFLIDLSPPPLTLICFNFHVNYEL